MILTNIYHFCIYFLSDIISHMFLKHIELNNFRNYEKLSLNFTSNKILLIGKNAQGKTNLLEAIFYMSTLNSIKAKTDSELINWNSDCCNVKLNFIRNDFETELSLTINPPKKKLLKINGLKENKSINFISNLSTVIFSTTDLLLLRGAPEDRRSWLDLAIGQIYPAYFDRLSKYNKIRTQKNNYLKELKGNIYSDSVILDVWNEQLQIAGSNIICLRQNFIKEITKTANEKHSLISNQEHLSLIYNSSITGEYNPETTNSLTSEQISKIFAEKQNEKKQEEIIRGQSVVGPHRDDISFFINGIDSKKFASQGQQRTIVLALKLSELELIKNKTGENAILLLDDVLAELDKTRQNYLLKAIGTETQTIITSVDTLHFDKEYLNDVEIFNVSSGKIGTK